MPEAIFILQPWYIVHQSAFAEDLNLLRMQSSKICSCLNAIVFGISTETDQNSAISTPVKKGTIVFKFHPSVFLVSLKKGRLKLNIHCMLSLYSAGAFVPHYTVPCNPTYMTLSRASVKEACRYEPLSHFPHFHIILSNAWSSSARS